MLVWFHCLLFLSSAMNLFVWFTQRTWVCCSKAELLTGCFTSVSHSTITTQSCGLYAFGFELDYKTKRELDHLISSAFLFLWKILQVGMAVVAMVSSTGTMTVVWTGLQISHVDLLAVTEGDAEATEATGTVVPSTSPCITQVRSPFLMFVCSPNSSFTQPSNFVVLIQERYFEECL